MALHTLVLTETQKGINDHGRHLGRRSIAKARAGTLGFLVVNISEKKITPAPGTPGVFSLVLDDQNIAAPTAAENLNHLMTIFEYYGYVTVT
jgi:hypothetical protein